MRTALLGVAVVMLLMVSSARAQEHAPAPHGTPAATAPNDTPHAAKPAAQPVLPAPSVMPGLVVIGILGLFVWAAAIGPVVRYHTPEEAPDAASHDDHGHDAHDAHGHGHGH